MINSRQLALILLCFTAHPLVAIAQELGKPIGDLSTQSYEKSETTWQLEIDELKIELETASKAFGSRHPRVTELKAKISFAEQSLKKLKARNEELLKQREIPQETVVQTNNSANEDILVELQQLVLKLTNRVMKLEDESRDLKAMVQKLSKSK